MRKGIKRGLKWGGIVVLVLLLAIQFVPVNRNNPPVVTDFDGPTEVHQIFKRSCYDCHSNETVWPWYSRVAPVSWLVAHDVEEGRAELNFSEWQAHAGNAHLMEEIVEEVAEGEMPLKIYLLTHGDATVSPAELELLRGWAGASEGDTGAGEAAEHEEYGEHAHGEEEQEQ